MSEPGFELDAANKTNRKFSNWAFRSMLQGTTAVKTLTSGAGDAGLAF